MNKYLDLWVIVFGVCIAFGLLVGLWSTFYRDGKSYTRRNLFRFDARAWFGVIAGIMVALAVLFSLPDLGATIWSNPWLGGPMTMSAIVVLMIVATTAAAYIAVLGAFYAGYAFKSVVVEMQLRHEEQRAEIAAGIAELDTATGTSETMDQ